MNHRWSEKLLVVLLLALALGNTKHSAFAEESQEEREAKQAADEAAAEKNLPEDQQYGKSYNGTLNLVVIDPTQPKPAVIGTFTIDKGATLQLKLAELNDSLMKRISLYDNKKCTLFGKLRNNGKYLIVSSIIEMANAPVMKRKRGGM
jgi:hypothetical protein